MSTHRLDHLRARPAHTRSANTVSPHTLTLAAKSADTDGRQPTNAEEDEQGTSKELGVAMGDVVGRVGPLRLGVLSAVVFWLLSRAVSGAASSGMQLPSALAGGWAVQVRERVHTRARVRERERERERKREREIERERDTTDF